MCHKREKQTLLRVWKQNQPQIETYNIGGFSKPIQTEISAKILSYQSRTEKGQMDAHAQMDYGPG